MSPKSRLVDRVLKDLTLLGTTVLLYVATEWLFFVTKASFFDPLPVLEKLKVLLISLGLLWFLAIPLQLFFSGVSELLSRSSLVPLKLSLLPSAVVLGSLCFVLLDTTVYSTTQFGVSTLQGNLRFLFGVVFVLICVFSYRIVRDIDGDEVFQRFYRKLFVLEVLLVVFAVLVYQLSVPHAGTERTQLTKRRDLPNILFFGGDGLSARFTSVYGHPRENMPFVNQFAKEALVAMNSYSNSSTTTGSVFTLLTGKLPTENHVVYYPNIFTGENVREHFVGLLKELGYFTAAINSRYIADPYDYNLWGAFDYANGRYRSLSKVPFSSVLPEEAFLYERFFLYSIFERLSDRLSHSFGLRRLPDFFAEADRMAPVHNDDRRVAELLSVIEKADSPFFAHVHLMGTHGHKFWPRKRRFSAGQIQSERNMQDFYEDAVRDFDDYFSETVASLKEKGLLENTIIVLSSDHGRDQEFARTPLIFSFPGKSYRGKLQKNVSHIDVGATLLDYLEVRKPSWMSGESLLKSEFDKMRPVFFIDKIIQEGRSAPFFAMRSLGMVVCNKVFFLDLRENRLRSASVEGHTDACPPSELPTSDVAHEMMLEHLRLNGWDVSSLE